MSIDEIRELIKKQLENKKNYSFENDIIKYHYKGETYLIKWEKEIYRSYYNSIVLSCDFIKNFRLGLKEVSINEVHIYETTLQRNKNIIWNKIKLLTKRIDSEVSIQEHKNQVEKESKPKIFNFIKKKLKIDLDSTNKLKYQCSINGNNYRTYRTNKIIRKISNFKFSVSFEKDNIQYYYNFIIYYPSEWCDCPLKKIHLENQTINYTIHKQITSKIRYAKLKKIFTNE